MSESTLTQKYNATTQTSTAYAIVVDTISAKDYPVSKIAFGAVGSVTYASAADPLPVTAVITGTVAATQSGTWTVTGAGGTFPVTGTFWQATQPVSGTVDLGATDNAVLDTIASPVVTRGAALPASAQALGVAVDGDVVQMPFAITTFADGVSYVGAYHLSTASHNYMFNGLTFDRMRGDTTNGLDVDVTRSALPSGASTSALQTTGNTSLAAIRTAVETIDNAISGNEMQVDVLTVPADPFGADADAASATGSISAKLRFIASTGIPVTGTVTVGSHAVTNAGTFATQDDARTTGGESSYSFLSTAAVQAAEIKGSAGTVYSMQFFNKNAAAMYVRLYNQTGAPASGDTANIVWRGMIPGNTAGTGYVVQFPKGKAFATGIGIRVSGAIADNDTTVLGANEVMGNVGFK
jgi:hypothetical protein